MLHDESIRSRHAAAQARGMSWLRARREALRAPWWRLAEAVEAAAEAEALVLWVRVVVEGAGSVPSQVREQVEARCPGASSLVLPGMEGESALRERLTAGIAPEAGEQGWCFALRYFMLQHELVRRTYERRSIVTGELYNAPHSEGSYDAWLEGLWRQPAPAPLTPDEAEAQYEARLVAPERLAAMVGRRVEWDVALAWLRSIEALRRALPHWVLADLMALHPSMDDTCKSLTEVAAWGEAALFRVPQEEGWARCLTFQAHRHLRWLRTDDFARHCVATWRRQDPDSLPSFADWLAMADAYTVPGRRSQSSSSIGPSRSGSR